MESLTAAQKYFMGNYFVLKCGYELGQTYEPTLGSAFLPPPPTPILKSLKRFSKFCKMDPSFVWHVTGTEQATAKEAELHSSNLIR